MAIDDCDLDGFGAGGVRGGGEDAMGVGVADPDVDALGAGLALESVGTGGFFLSL